MNSVVALLLFLALVLTPLFLSIGLMDLFDRKQRNKKNPLTQNIRRPPGGTVHRKLQGAYMNQMFPLCMLAMATALPASIHLFQSQVLEKPESLLRYIFTGATILGISIYGLIGIYRGKKKIRTLALGYECELAVGQALDQLMLKGFRIFHDLEGNNFNLDHVLVGPGGVFAIETKGKSKLLGTASNNKANPKVLFSNGEFQFPKGVEKDWVGQAKRQASWLKGWLSKSVGFELFVQPVIVVAGWYVETKSPHPVKAIGSGQIDYYFDRLNAQTLTNEQVDQISYQLDQRTRDLEPGEIRKPLGI